MTIAFWRREREREKEADRQKELICIVMLLVPVNVRMEHTCTYKSWSGCVYIHVHVHVHTQSFNVSYWVYIHCIYIYSIYHNSHISCLLGVSLPLSYLPFLVCHCCRVHVFLLKSRHTFPKLIFTCMYLAVRTYTYNVYTRANFCVD